MDPYASLIIGRARMEELRREAALHRQATQIRADQGEKLRAVAGQALIRLGERILPTHTPRLGELPR